MSTVGDFCDFLDEFAPPRLAEEWDNVGLLLGDRRRDAPRVMTCLTLTPESVEEAVTKQADLVVAHHPLPFRPLKRITAETVVGDMLLRLIENRVAVYSPHTSFDSAGQGINQRLAEGLGLTRIQPLQAFRDDPDGLGAGRHGDLPASDTLASMVNVVKQFLRIDGLYYVGNLRQEIGRVAVACGSAGQFLSQAVLAGCDLLVTGETNFHTCLEARARGKALILPGHYASERFAVQWLARRIADEFADTEAWASTAESDPLRWK